MSKSLANGKGVGGRFGPAAVEWGLFTAIRESSGQGVRRYEGGDLTSTPKSGDASDEG